MATDAESVVRRFLDAYARRDRAAVLDHYAHDAVWHVVAWQEPRVGRDAISVELDQQFAGFSERRSELRNVLAEGGVVMVEGIDVVVIGESDVSIHWVSAFEVDADAKIASQRDYWDAKELEAQLT